MQFRVGMETNYENRALAWVLGHPGAYVFAPDAEAALAAVPSAVRAYAVWMEQHSHGQVRLDVEPLSFSLDETWEVYSVNEEYDRQPDAYDVNAWFLHDWKPLTEEEIALAAQIIAWARQDLLAAVQDLNPRDLDVEFPGERWSMGGVLRHVATAEWWYMSRLGLSPPREELSHDPFERLDQVRAHLLGILPSFAGQSKVIGVDAEFWSPRKLVRRTAWHERDHTDHILRLRSLLPEMG
jgi:uncharacterized damage-inducible protein DinB